MRVLAVIPHAMCDAGVFGDEAVAGGHEFDEWQPAEAPLPRPVADYDAVISFGGGMQADEDERYAWLRTALDVLADALEREIPTLGVCLGGQMLARAAGGWIGPAERAEWGFDSIELTDAGRQDPLFAGQPTTLEVFQWHAYSFQLPPGAIALAHSPVCLQAFRVGELAWGLQWHPEVTAETVAVWGRVGVPAPRGVPVAIDLPQLEADVAVRMQRANREGRELCARFLQVAEEARSLTGRRSAS